MSGPLLQVENLKKYYPTRSGWTSRSSSLLRAVDDVSFTLPAGTTLGLVGESGCGKSTLGRQIVALERPTAGRILFDGQDLNALPDARLRALRPRMQMVFQDSYSSLNPRRRVREILADPMIFHGLADRRSVGAEVEKLLQMVGLPARAAERYPHEFSGGQRQRVAIARALSLRPDLLVCDEPVSALDVSVQAQILNLLADLQKQLGLACLFIGHGLAAVRYVSDRIAVMYLGRIVEMADAEELFSHPLHPYTQALIRAVPIPDPEQRSTAPLLQGEALCAPAEPQGCLFAPRCPLAREECLRQTPALRPVSADGSHLSACPYSESKE